jgi:hypothetical protein
MAREFKDFSVEELQGYYSDFHKDFYGWRPRGATPEQWNNKQFLVAEINCIHDAMDAMKETFNGREKLRTNGWVIDEAEYDAIIDPMEYANWCADQDAIYYGA